MLRRFQELTLKIKLAVGAALVTGITAAIVAIVDSPAGQHAVRIGQG
jgi:hypothetical protein